MIYCNPVPIANSCMMGKDVVADALSSIFQAIIDLIKFGQDVDLAFNFCNVKFYGKNLKVVWRPEFVSSIQNKSFETTMKRAQSPNVSSTWRTSYTKAFAASTLGNLIQKPNQDVVKTLNEKTAALKMMSLDMSSSAKFNQRQMGNY